MMRRRQKVQTCALRRPMALPDLFDFAKRPEPAEVGGSCPLPMDDELWSIKIVKAKTGLSRASVYKYMEQGLFPRQRHLGPGRVAWRASDVRAWIGSRPE